MSKFIKSKEDGELLMTVKDFKPNGGTQIVVKKLDPANDGFQKWFFKRQGSGYVSIEAESTPPLAMSIDEKPATNVKVINKQWTGSDYQLWKIEERGEGYSIISPKLNKGGETFVMTLENQSTVPNTNVVLVQFQAGIPTKAQLWKADTN
ncbi:uncharacterized protein LOC118419979 [Branchiostoma floridae]|uniref:Uncharacterized protein LOC118419979 n=1 Tax=Branchiostoma floridae TaxID=7739 RepID=A0A9J7MXQ2_BRAFL|nr:uncharacterized protein LOC118419979 [Branchiostoma floridae]